MMISPFSIGQLIKFISGDTPETIRLTGQELVDFFNSFGERDVYDYQNGGIFCDTWKGNHKPSRSQYVKHKLEKLNGSKKLKEILERVVNHHASHKESTLDAINKIIAPDGQRFEEVEGSYVMVTKEFYDEEIAKEVHFEEIQGQILAELDLAKFTIWVAVAWFTDQVLFNKLIEKQRQGLNVQIVVIEDDINKNYGCSYETYFETYRVSKSTFENIMHHKFCVIDLDTVINGSYNWTNKARYNKENITIDKSRALAESFAKQFILLKTGN